MCNMIGFAMDGHIWYNLRACMTYEVFGFVVPPHAKSARAQDLGVLALSG